MILSIWRYAHLALALISSLFLILLSVTGIILAVNAVYEKLPAYRVDNIQELNLAQVIPTLHEVYPEMMSLSVDHRGFVSIDALNEDGETVKGFINPNDGKLLGELKPQNAFVQWTTVLHRSLFLKETGRVIVALVSFFLFLITLSGIVLIAKRQQGFRHFFAKINKDFFAQYFHVVSGRWALLPILIIALTGTYLFLVRMDMFKGAATAVEHTANAETEKPLETKDFPVFQTTLLADVEQINFPFMPDDPDEFYELKLKDAMYTVNQITGAIHEETKYPYSAFWERLSLDLHTGRTNIIWAIILGLASINILAFIYTGFVITLRRTKTKIKNKYKANQAEIIILVGSENGSTLAFANKIHTQLLADGQKSWITFMNNYEAYPQAKQLLVFTSTFGLGDPPTNALKFETLLAQFPQNQQVKFSVVGFGSKAYLDYCGYAQHIDQILAQQPWATRFLPLHTINDRSVDELVSWIHRWTEHSLITLATATSVYSEKPVGMKKWKVIEKTNVDPTNSTFKVILAPLSSVAYQSGDLLAIYPADDHRERLYSVGKNGKNIQLIVKLHEPGLGSGHLHNLTIDQEIKARLMPNKDFHLPKKAKEVAMISNGTGIAPFLGMIMENKKSIPISLYCGFRHDDAWIANYKKFATQQIQNKRLTDFQTAFSRELHMQYVMDLIQADGAKFAKLLADNGVIMICGSLAMQRDVEDILDQIVQKINGKPLTHYKAQQQILSDCY